MHFGCSSSVSRGLGLHVAWFLFLTSVTVAPAAEFDLKDPKGVNAVVFSIDSRLEPLRGYASGISGTVSFDPAAPQETRGKIQVTTASLTFPNERMANVAKSAEWLDAETYPTITFTFLEVVSVATPSAELFELTVRGNFECRGTARELTVPVSISHLPGELASRLGDDAPGDLIILRSVFSIQRADYGIRPDIDFGKVGSEIRLDVALAGAAPQAPVAVRD